MYGIASQSHAPTDTIFLSRYTDTKLSLFTIEIHITVYDLLDLETASLAFRHLPSRKFTAMKRLFSAM